MSVFVSGMELARAYWSDVVRPILDAHIPSEVRAVALLGDGSDVLGFDSEQSTDHGWGPRLFVFTPNPLHRDEEVVIDRAIDQALPETFDGHPTRFAARDDAPVRHQIRLCTVAALTQASLGFDATETMSTRHWLQAPSQALLALTAGGVFEDGPGDLSRVREKLRWYPDDVWIYLLGCQWRRLDQEEPFAGRCAQVGDDLGSGVVAARLVRDLMRLCFLIERRYTPYSKWLGTAFTRLSCGPELMPMLRSAIAEDDWHERERHLTSAFEAVAAMFNRLGVTEPQEPVVRSFYERPFRVLGSGRFAEACMAQTPLRDLGYVGAIDQFIDSTDVLAYPERAAKVAGSVWP